ncbi:hypothetical protein [Amycolatopsis methanolica]|uniref:Uncharacterized protein n=1 Tax=Amycolatopsis methanolica 239 TaxID=1068978 RepID=A0A076MTU1_AMYME|nr:hypothetical protein [Amycolatopsis methanolica]AIJ24358.1 hypothetical protein AMETH_4266 [Amycolatopsis methanolica 239]
MRDVGGAVTAAVVDEDQPQRPRVALGEQRGQRLRQDPGLVAGVRRGGSRWSVHQNRVAASHSQAASATTPTMIMKNSFPPGNRDVPDPMG